MPSYTCLLRLHSAVSQHARVGMQARLPITVGEFAVVDTKNQDHCCTVQTWKEEKEGIKSRQLIIGFTGAQISLPLWLGGLALPSLARLLRIAVEGSAMP